MRADQETHPRLSRRLLATAWERRRERHFQLQVLLAALFAISLGAFLHLVEDYLTGDPIVRWDLEFSSWLHEHSNGTLVSVMKIVTLAGNVAFLAVLTLAVAAYLLRHRAFNEATLVCGSAFGIDVLNGVLKLVFHRPRPELAFVHLDTYSFPSGHAAGSAAIYGVILYLLAVPRGRGGRIACTVGYVVLVSAIGFSRLYLEAHYLSDVLAGTALGIAWASGCLSLYEARGHFDVLTILPGRARRLAGRRRTAGT